MTAQSWQQRTAVFAAALCVALVSLILRDLPPPVTGQSYIVEYALTHHGTVWFADELEADGRYTKTEGQPSPASTGRIIHGINLDEDSAPRRLLTAISSLPELKWLVVSPPVSNSPGFHQLREKLRHTRIIVHWTPSHAPVRTISTPSEFYDAIAEDRMVLLLYAALSMDAAVARSPFCELAAASAGQHQKVDFVIFDFKKEVFTPFWDEFNDWLATHSIPQLGYHGYGKAIWVSRGSALHWEFLDQKKSNAALLETTHDIFDSAETLRMRE